VTPLETGQLTVMRVHAAIAALLLLIAAAVAEHLLRGEFGLPRGAVVLPLLAPLAWMVLIAPVRRFRAWGYRMEAEELHVAYGVWTRIETVVPLARIEHIDIAQGPLERACGVSRLIVHTAGTLHSQVLVPGLARATSEAMRDEIRARIGQPER
jgi:membrane protein YdbS with pleckstrin-like domain